MIPLHSFFSLLSAKYHDILGEKDSEAVSPTGLQLRAFLLLNWLLPNDIGTSLLCYLTNIWEKMRCLNATLSGAIKPAPAMGSSLDLHHNR